METFTESAVFYWMLAITIGVILTSLYLMFRGDD